jgi:hypothetical protein
VGPGDAGPASLRQVILDFLNRRLPGVPPATSSVVDARDVAEAMWLAAVYGRRLSGVRAPLCDGAFRRNYSSLGDRSGK